MKAEDQTFALQFERGSSGFKDSLKLSEALFSYKKKYDQHKNANKNDSQNYNQEFSIHNISANFNDISDLNEPLERKQINFDYVPKTSASSQIGEQNEINIKQSNEQNKETLLQKFKRVILRQPQIQTVSRKISFTRDVTPPNFFQNVVRNQRYNIFTFLPIVLFEQFKFFINLFYLLLTITQFIPVLQVGFMFTYLSPLVFVICITMMKEAYDDILRYKRDKQANSFKYNVLQPDGKILEVPSCNLQVGFIVQVKQDQRIPADMILLSTESDNGTVFLRTDQLDGETDWKLRTAIKHTHELVRTHGLQHLQTLTKSFVTCQEPISNIYEFNGFYQAESTASAYQPPNNNNDENKDFDLEIPIFQNADSSAFFSESLKLDHTLWGSTFLATSSVWAMVVYTGKETRMSINSREARTKVGRLDEELNYLSKLLFVFLSLLSLVIVLLDGVQLKNWQTVIQFFRILLLLSSIIPISMKVNLDMAKIIFTFKINRDAQISGTIARNSTIPDELGRIQYLLTDKTGTLTQNDMLFRRISMDYDTRYTHEENQEMRRILKQACQQESKGQVIKQSKSFQKAQSAKILNDKSQEIQQQDQNAIEDQQNSQMKQQQQLLSTKQQTPRAKQMRFLKAIQALILCHNVTPVYQKQDTLIKIDENQKKQLENEIQKENQNEKKTENSINLLLNNDKPIMQTKSFQASSPDEIALVIAAESLGFDLSNRSQQQISYTDPTNTSHAFEILDVFSFSSHRKRMGIIVRNKVSNKIIFYLKGADVVMVPKVKLKSKIFLQDECDNLAREGLRTLVVMQKYLKQHEYDDWKRRYIDASKINMSNVKSKQKELINDEESLINELESNMDFLCVTGVEDRLQEHVYDTIDKLKHAGIRVWMLTGDKLETAMCIAISTGLKAPENNFHIIQSISDVDIIRLSLLELKNKNSFKQKYTCLVIDGDSLKVALEKLEELFYNTTSDAPAVICCRCSPKQKAQVVEGIKKFTKMITASVGDGGNDVGMIQMADAGIGIVGKEGLQAALAADFSITQFSHLSKLLLWHGRLAYKQSAVLSQFVIHRGLIISVIQAIFTCIFYFVAIPIYNGMLMLGYSTIFTFLPVFSLIFDEDIELKKALDYPELYKSLLKSRELNAKTFCFWCWKSLYQGALIMLLAVLLFDSSFLNIVTITFSALIITEFLNIFSELHSYHIIMLCSQVASVVIYSSAIVFFKQQFNVSTLTYDFLWKMLVLMLVSWMPLHVFKWLQQYFFPSDYLKIMKDVNKLRINMNIKLI